MKTFTIALILGCLHMSTANCATVLTEQTTKKTVRVQSVAGPTNLFLYNGKGEQTELAGCSLHKEYCELSRVAEGQLRKVSAIRLYLKDDNGNEVWSLWQDQFPDPYDFRLANQNSETILVFARGCGVSIITRLDKNSENQAYLSYLRRIEPVVRVDLCAMFGAEAFRGGDNALRENVKIKKVYFEKGWHVAIEGNGGKEYLLAAENGNWIGVSK